MEIGEIADLTFEIEEDIIWCEEAVNLNKKKALLSIPIKTNLSVWKYFRLINTDSMICVKCCKKFKFLKSSITSYKYHITVVHKIVIKDNVEGKVKRRRGIFDHFVRIDQSYLDKIVYRWLTNNNVSTTVLEHIELQELMDMLKYKLPTRIAYNNYLDSETDLSLRGIKEKIENSTVSLTADGWKSASNNSFLGITIRIITEDFHMFNYWCYLKEIYPSTSESIVKHIETMETTFGIKDPTNITTDGAPNMLLAVRRILGGNGVKCFAHTCTLIKYI